MQASWKKLDDGTWGVSIVSAPWPNGTGAGMPVTVTTRKGRESVVTLGEHVRQFRIAGGKFVDIYKVADTSTDDDEETTSGDGVRVRKPSDEQPSALHYLALSQLAISDPNAAERKLAAAERELRGIQSQPTSLDYFTEAMRERARAEVLTLEISVLRHALDDHEE